jgi:hypothetical protein
MGILKDVNQQPGYNPVKSGGFKDVRSGRSRNGLFNCPPKCSSSVQ